MNKIVFLGVLAVAMLCFMQTNAKALNSEEDGGQFRHGHDNMGPPPGFNGKFKLMSKVSYF